MMGLFSSFLYCLSDPDYQKYKLEIWAYCIDSQYLALLTLAMIKYLLLLTVFPLTLNAQETPNTQFTKETNNVDNWTRSIYGSVVLITYTDRQSGRNHIDRKRPRLKSSH